MRKIRINLDTVNKIKSFVQIIMTVEPDIDIASDTQRYIVDAKSMMGIFSLDVSRDLNMIIHSDDDTVCDKIEELIAEFKVA